MLLVPCALFVLSGVAMAWSVPGHNDGNGSGSSCRDWKRSGPGCPPPAPPTTKPPWKPPWKPPTKPPTTTTKPPWKPPPSPTTSTTQPTATPATIGEPPDAAPASAPSDQALAAAPRAVGSTVSDVPAASPATDIVAAPALPGLPQAVPGLEQPEVPPAASFEDDVLLPGSIALVLAVAGLATAFLVYQGASGHRGPRGPSGPIDDGETLEFQ